MGEPIQPPGLPQPSAAFSHGVASGDLIFVAGEIAQGPDGAIVGEGDVATQTRQTLRNVEAVLRAAGANLQDVVSTTVYLSSFDGYREYDRAYAEAFGDHRPARATLRADLVRDEALIEIQAIARRAR
ncbi:MAG: RidA family protein [Actinomycetota bacterium]